MATSSGPGSLLITGGGGWGNGFRPMALCPKAIEIRVACEKLGYVVALPNPAFTVRPHG
jgi:hypothetical protein